MTRSQMKLFSVFVEFVDDSAIGSRKLDRVGSDRGENRLEVQSRADGLTDRAQGSQFPDRLCQLACPRLQFLKQPHVLDGDDRLVGKGFEQRDLIISERTDLLAADRNNPDR